MLRIENGRVINDMVMEPEVAHDTDRHRVRFDLRWDRTVRTVAGGEPASSEDCDELLAWAERMEAALDNFTSAVRIIQSRMEPAMMMSVRGGATRAELDALAEEELPDDHPSWGAGGRSTYEEG